jgi:large subunit ribosomal protein L5e
MIIQDKNKYKTPKYRFVIRITNKDIIAQIFSADLTHDVCIASAYAHELKRYGITVGLTNYAAAYATGLLLARRINKKFELGYEGQADVDGADFNVEADEGGKAPFKAILDIGIARTTTGARIFGALKGATDGGVDIPHKDRRFPGSKKPEGAGEWTADAEVHKKYIFGGHVADYMKKLEADDEETFGKHFKRFVDAGLTADKLEAVYTKAHKAIRADPFKKRDPLEKGNNMKRDKPRPKEVEKKRWNQLPKTVQQRKARIYQKLKAKGVKDLKEQNQISDAHFGRGPAVAAVEEADE